MAMRWLFIIIACNALITLGAFVGIAIKVKNFFGALSHFNVIFLCVCDRLEMIVVSPTQVCLHVSWAPFWDFFSS
jgi:hypothetical protein